jgi:hypothetical protein
LRQAVALAQEIGTHQFAVAEGQHAEGLLHLGISEGVEACRDIAAGVRRLKTIREDQRKESDPGRPATDHLEIYAFGEGRIVRDGLTVSSSEWQAAMAKEVFFYILLNGPVERDTIGAVFWPDLSRKQTVSNFHSTLHRIRRALGTETVVTNDGQYRVGDVDYWLDVEEFETLIKRAQLLPPHDVPAGPGWRGTMPRSSKGVRGSNQLVQTLAGSRCTTRRRASPYYTLLCQSRPALRCTGSV